MYIIILFILVGELHKKESCIYMVIVKQIVTFSMLNQLSIVVHSLHMLFVLFQLLFRLNN